MNIAHLLQRAAHVDPRRVAIARGTAPVADYGALSCRAGAIARYLVDTLRLGTGDRVVLFMTNCPEYVECMFACWQAGLVCVPVNAKLHARELAFILSDSDARAAFFTADLSAIVGEAATTAPRRVTAIEIGGRDFRTAVSCEPMAMQPAADGDPAWLFYTSGTTGRPKGATLTHANLLAMTLGYFADVDRPSPDDCILHAAPMSHGSGLYVLPHVAAMASQVIPESGHFEPGEILDLFDRLSGVSMFAAPTMVNRLVKNGGGGAYRGLRSIVYGGGPMYVEDCRSALDLFGNRLIQIYGQGESPMTITVLPKRLHSAAAAPDLERQLASVGYRQAIVEVATVGEDGRPVLPGEVGEVMVRGPTVMRGYWNDPEGTARTLPDGWLKTGDMGAFDRAGLLTLKDRSKDVIISGGSNVYPREVEEALRHHPDLSEVAVIGRQSPEWGEEVVAFVVRRPGGSLTEDDLDAVCNARIARFKRPKAYFFVDHLPKNNYGKIVKTELRGLLGTPAGVAAGSVSDGPARSTQPD